MAPAHWCRYTVENVSNKGWSTTTIRNTIISSFVILALVFGYTYFTKINPFNLVNNNLPFSVTGGQPQYLFAIYGSGMNGSFYKPMDVTVANDRIYVTDTGNKRVQVFDKEGNPVLTFGKAGDKPGEFDFPYGIAGDAAGQIYVSDMNNATISLFSGQGKFIKVFLDKKAVAKPGGIFITGDRLYATDIDEGKVKVFSLTGKKLLEFGSRGKGKDQLDSPNCVTVSGNRVYVADSGNDRVQVYSTAGKYVSTIGFEKGSKTSLFVNPRGMGVSGGRIFIASKITSYLFAFDSSGNRQLAWGGMGQDDEQFALPNGLYVDNQGRIYIVDSGNQRVDVYQN